MTSSPASRRRATHALLALNDPVAVAWRSDPTPGAGNWAGRLARIAGCTRSTVYNRRDEWWQTYGIDIARPLQLYSDILYYGHNSIAKPESITALMVAVDQEDGDEAVRLHAEAIADFERKRVEIVNPAFVQSTARDGTEAASARLARSRVARAGRPGIS